MQALIDHLDRVVIGAFVVHFDRRPVRPVGELDHLVFLAAVDGLKSEAAMEVAGLVALSDLPMKLIDGGKPLVLWHRNQRRELFRDEAQDVAVRVHIKHFDFVWKEASVAEHIGSGIRGSMLLIPAK